MTRSAIEVLQELGLQHHAGTFEENSIETLEDLTLLSNQDLKDLGVTKIGERNRLTAYLQKRNSILVQSPTSPPSSSRSTNGHHDYDHDTAARPISRKSTNPFDDDEEEEEDDNNNDDFGHRQPSSIQSNRSTNPFDSDDNDDEIGHNMSESPSAKPTLAQVSPQTKPRPTLAQVSPKNKPRPTLAQVSPKNKPRPAMSKDPIMSTDDPTPEDEDLAMALEAMNIDQDFACWKSFRSSVSSRKSGASISVDTSDATSQRSQLTQADEQDLRYWKSRVERDEVYSHHYRPVPRELRELDDLTTFLGIQKQSGSSTSVASSSSPGGGLRNLVPGQRKKFQDSPNSTKKQQPPEDHNQVLSYLFSKDNPPYSILLKRGPVLFRLSSKNSESNMEERELILLTHGFILARVNDNNSSRMNPLSGRFLKNWIQRSYDECHLYTNVESVKDTSSNQGFTLHLADEKKTVLDFECATEFHRAAWLDALERVLVETYTRSTHGVRLEEEESGGKGLGWQHMIAQTSLFSASMMGDVHGLERRLGEATKSCSEKVVLNRLDKYHHLSALHYATHYHHMHCMRVLLEAGADPNIENFGTKDKDDLFQTPMYMAQRNEWQRGMDLLLDFGAKPSRMAELERGGGELFANARVIEQRVAASRDHSNRYEQTHSRAKTAQGTMSENMNALHLRGQKIEELGQKTSKLQADASSYADYAKQLKEKTKKQSRWGF